MSSIFSHQQLVLYGTLGCHLCELAEQQLLSYVEQGWQVELVDIADDDQLFDRFSLVIPVLQHRESGRLLNWPFDKAALAVFLSDEALLSGQVLD
ncbi:MAG TPA: glutaredoxin family protein [Pseudomonadales bacterium]|nr:glutaredoxin family protein [Pseudomonadales bacterium]